MFYNKKPKREEKSPSTNNNQTLFLLGYNNNKKQLLIFELWGDGWIGLRPKRGETPLHLTLDVLTFESVSEKMRFVLYIFILLYFRLFYSRKFMTHFRTIISTFCEIWDPFWVINFLVCWNLRPVLGHKLHFISRYMK